MADDIPQRKPFRDILRAIFVPWFFKKKNGDRSNGLRNKVFPISKGIHILLLGLAFWIGTMIYGAVIESLHRDYRDAMASAQVICPLLSNYGISNHRACKDNRFSLTPRDFSTLMIAAGIEKESDLEDPNDILDLKRTGPGAWITTALISSGTRDLELPLHRMLVEEVRTSVKDCDDAGSKESYRIGTLHALVSLYRELGVPDGANSTLNECHYPLHHDVARRSDDLISYLSGYPSRGYAPWVKNEQPKVQDVIKTAMRKPWKHYTRVVAEKGQYPLYEYRNGGYQKKTVDEKVQNVGISETRWHKKEKEQLFSALFSFSNLLINEVNRDDRVKKARYIYQAARGSIQWALVVLILYLALQLLWRYVAARMQAVSDSEVRLLHLPVMVQGTIDDIEMLGAESRTYIDQLISTLPLIGLFGTVVGILLGLPEASAAVTATGPGASEAINELFIQLGLAFSTTALAIAGVIIIDFLWEVLQSFEDHALWERQAGSSS